MFLSKRGFEIALGRKIVAGDYPRALIQLFNPSFNWKFQAILILLLSAYFLYHGPWRDAVQILLSASMGFFLGQALYGNILLNSKSLKDDAGPPKGTGHLDSPVDQ